MDTDSLYLALSGETINSVVKPTIKDQFEAMLNMCTNGTDTDNIDDRFLSRTCCEPCASWDKRVPGLFKIEQTGTEMIALCSKTYLVVDGDNTKMSSKGVNKSRVENPYKTFLQVLNNRTSEYVENVGIRTLDHRLYTHRQRKIGFDFLYLKREVQSDYKSTKPLNMTLCPKKQIQCTICHGFFGQFIPGHANMYFCHDCVNFIDVCGSD